MRILAGSIALSLVVSGCCMMGGNGSVPVVPPPVPVPATSFTSDCMGLCQRSGACMDARGAPRGADEANCAASCAPGGSYANMPPESLACVASPTCEAFDACNGAALAAMLGRVLGGPPSTPPSGPAVGPEGWPAGFPVVAGGTAMPVPPAGPVRVAVLAYTGTTPDALDASYHAALASAGWTAPPSESGPEAHRFTAISGATSVSVSIYAEGGQTMIQTMQMLF